MKKFKKNKEEIIPLPEIKEEEDLLPEQTLNQKKIALAQSQHASVIIELVRDVLQKVPIVGRDEWETIKNAIIIDTSSTILRDLVEYLEKIKKGNLIGK